MIVVLGSANMDRIVHVDHFPVIGETSIACYETMNSGGKGANQSIAARKMGSDVYFFGAVGQDRAGNMLLENFQAHGIDLAGTRVVTFHLSGVAYITVDKKGDNTILYVPGANYEVKASQVPDCLLNSDNVILLQMEINPVENWKLIHKVKEKKENGARIILNAAPMVHVPTEIISSIDVLIMNSTEALMLSDNLNIGSEEFSKIARTVSERFGNICIITMGEDGVLAAHSQGMIRLPAIDVNAIDTTSAGDAFVGTFASYLDRGYSLKDSIMAGNIAGGLTTTKKGAQESLPTGEEVTSVFKQLKEQQDLLQQ